MNKRMKAALVGQRWRKSLLSISLLVSAVFTLACQTPRNEVVLSECAVDCAAGLDCLAGFCTNKCDVNDAESCTSLSPLTVCADWTGDPDNSPHCDRECADNKDCLALSEVHTCQSGACRAPDVSRGNRDGVSVLQVDAVYTVRLLERPESGDHLCLDDQLELDLRDDGELPLRIVTMKLEPSSKDALDCSLPGRKAINREMLQRIKNSHLLCDRVPSAECDTVQMCEILRIDRSKRDACYYDEILEGKTAAAGACYIDPSLQNLQGDYTAGGGEDGTNSLLNVCKKGQSMLRFVGLELKDEIVFAASTPTWR